MNASSKLLRPIERKAIVLPALKKELERLPEEGAFGSNREAIKELKTWISELESGKYTSEEVVYFMREDGKWIYSALCDYLP